MLRWVFVVLLAAFALAMLNTSEEHREFVGGIFLISVLLLALIALFRFFFLPRKPGKTTLRAKPFVFKTKEKPLKRGL